MKNLLSNLARFQTVQEAAFFDNCKIQVFTSGSDTFGDILKTYTSGSEIACSVGIQGGTKNYKDGTIQATNEVLIHVPISTVVSNQDRILITKRLGATANTAYQILSVESGIGVLILKAQVIEV
jgi:hypothetical protein